MRMVMRKNTSLVPNKWNHTQGCILTKDICLPFRVNKSNPVDITLKWLILSSGILFRDSRDASREKKKKKIVESGWVFPGHSAPTLTSEMTTQHKSVCVQSNLCKPKKKKRCHLRKCQPQIWGNTKKNNTHMLSDKHGISVVGANIVICNGTFLWYNVQYLQQVDFLVIQCYL